MGDPLTQTGEWVTHCDEWVICSPDSQEMPRTRELWAERPATDEQMR